MTPDQISDPYQVALVKEFGKAIRSPITDPDFTPTLMKLILETGTLSLALVHCQETLKTKCLARYNDLLRATDEKQDNRTLVRLRDWHEANKEYLEKWAVIMEVLVAHCPLSCFRQANQKPQSHIRDLLSAFHNGTINWSNMPGTFQIPTPAEINAYRDWAIKHKDVFDYNKAVHAENEVKKAAYRDEDGVNGFNFAKPVAIDGLIFELAYSLERNN